MDIKERKITAKEARELADSSTLTLNRIYKVIREEAKEGRTKLHWCCADCSTIAVGQVVFELKQAGFEVEIMYNTSAPDDKKELEGIEVAW